MPKQKFLCPDGQTILSLHASERANQRHFSPADIDFVLRFGRIEYRTGTRFIFLGRKEFSATRSKDPRHKKLIGTVLVISNDTPDEDIIITVYQDENALHKIRKKSKYRSEAKAA